MGRSDSSWVVCNVNSKINVHSERVRVSVSETRRSAMEKISSQGREKCPKTNVHLERVRVNVSETRRSAMENEGVAQYLDEFGSLSLFIA